MKKNEKPVLKPIDLLILSCVIYTPITIIINLLCHLMLHGAMLKIWANLIVFGVSALIASIAFFAKKVKIKDLIVSRTAWIYTILSFLINTFVYIIWEGYLWKIWTIILLFSYALIVSVLMKILKIKNYLIRTLIYYALSLGAFLTMTLAIADYDSGNSAMLLFAFFTVFYIVSSFLFYFVRRSFLAYENEEKEYKRQFD